MNIKIFKNSILCFFNISISVLFFPLPSTINTHMCIHHDNHVYVNLFKFLRIWRSFAYKKNAGKKQKKRINITRKRKKRCRHMRFSFICTRYSCHTSLLSGYDIIMLANDKKYCELYVVMYFL
jgi:hypothetical protein